MTLFHTVLAAPILSHHWDAILPRYLSAACTCGQATSAVPLGEDGSSPAETLARSGDTARGNSHANKFACIEKYGGVRFEVWQLARMTESGQR
jgi:hypothetical protein